MKIIEIEKSILIPAELARFFAPATCLLFEWQEYWLTFPEADRLRVGSNFIKPIENSGLFCLIFKNQLGLTEIQPMAGSRPLSAPLCVEVISPKFPTPTTHLGFFRSLLSDLYSRAARFPFIFDASTSQSVVESLEPPTPLFIFHYIIQNSHLLQSCLQIILSNPHRVLSDHEERVPIFQAREADPEVLFDILTHTNEWVPAHGFPLAEKLNGYAPNYVWQRLPEDTFDTSENRFVLAFLRQILIATEMLPVQSWWQNISEERKRIIHWTTGVIRQTLQHPMFNDVGPMTRIPLESRTLQHKEGYRDILKLWLDFQQSRRPLFEPLQRAIEVRDIATLYEFWTFFAIAEEIAVLSDESPVFNLHLTDQFGLNWKSEAHFRNGDRLIYNQSFHRRSGRYHSYSVGLRPDFVWVQDNRPKAIFDAKFRMSIEYQSNDSPDVVDEPEPIKRPVIDDLYKMHTYRDALGVPVVMSVYPGNQAVFFDEQHGYRNDITFGDILENQIQGVGAIPLCPVEIEQVEPGRTSGKEVRNDG